MLMGPIDLIMDELVIVMSLFAVLGATRIEGFVCGQKRNVGFIMMLWQIQIGNVLICHMTSMFSPYIE